MEFRIIIPESGCPVYNDKTLKQATKTIYEKAEKIAVSMFEIAALIAKVDAECAYQTDGFQSVHEWTQNAFGIKKTLTYNLLRIGREYCQVIKSTTTGKQIGMKSNLTDAAINEDFTVSQVCKMLPLGHAAALELCEAGTITPDMTCRDIEHAVKAFLGDEDEDEDSKPKKKGKEPEEPEQETPLQTIMRIAEFIAQNEDAMSQAQGNDTDTANADIYEAFNALADALYNRFPNQ